MIRGKKGTEAPSHHCGWCWVNTIKSVLFWSSSLRDLYELLGCFQGRSELHLRPPSKSVQSSRLQLEHWILLRGISKSTKRTDQTHSPLPPLRRSRSIQDPTTKTKIKIIHSVQSKSTRCLDPFLPRPFIRWVD